MKDWRAVAARLRAWLSAAWVCLKGWSATTWPRLRAWLSAAWVRLKGWLATAWTRLKAWLSATCPRLAALAWEHRERLVPAVGLLGISLAVFLALVLTTPNPAQRVGQRYLDAAFSYDYMGLYGLFDDQVLERELVRYGLDRNSMAALARTNSGQLEGYVADIERRYSVKISFSHKIAGQSSLERDEREAMERRYAVDGMAVEVLDARRVSMRVMAGLAGAGRWEEREWELELTAIATPRGWSLERDSMYAFLDIIYDLPSAAQGAFGT